MVPSGINVPPGKLGKKNNRTVWNNSAPWKTMRSYQYGNAASNLQSITKSLDIPLKWPSQPNLLDYTY